MSDIIERRVMTPGAGVRAAVIPLPAPRIPGAGVSVRVAVPGGGDLAFIDRLQKMHSHMVGWSPTKQLEANIAAGQVLIAEAISDQPLAMSEGSSEDSKLTAKGYGLTASPAAPVGYCISRDQYMKRDDVGIVYQLNVLPQRQRHLVGATLIKAVFERAAYGCRLFCCWCAQDIQANHFWESLGFVPLAFRTGSRSRQRIHIFWQKRVRAGDEQTPYWFPAQTSAGAVAEDRLVLPIPPGTHWRDAKPVVLPNHPAAADLHPRNDGAAPQLLPGSAPVRPRPASGGVTKAQAAAIARSHSRHLGGVPTGKVAIIVGGSVRYIDRAPRSGTPNANRGLSTASAQPKPPRKPKHKNDPKYVAAARELRDRFLEQVSAGQLQLPGRGKYNVSRALEARPTELTPMGLLGSA